MDAGEFRNRYGPVALVTGASSGIGVGFAEELAERGLDLVLVARREDRMAALRARLEAAHGIAIHLAPIDLSRPEAPAEVLAACAPRDVGLVVSNAGFGLKGRHEANDPQFMTEMLAVNCNVPLQLAHGFIPRLRERGRGALLFTASTEGLIGCPYSAAYSGTKALVVALGEALWGELEGSGIDVLTLCPGATESEAAAKQGIDPATLTDQMPAREAAVLALDRLGEGPTYVSGERYAAMFEQLRAMPRRDALRAMAAAMKR